MVGCETAEFLAKQHKTVTILEMLDKIGNDIGPALRPVILERLKSAGIHMEITIQVVEITETGIKGLRYGQASFFKADTVVLAVVMRSEKWLAEA